MGDSDKSILTKKVGMVLTAKNELNTEVAGKALLPPVVNDACVLVVLLSLAFVNVIVRAGIVAIHAVHGVSSL